MSVCACENVCVCERERENHLQSILLPPRADSQDLNKYMRYTSSSRRDERGHKAEGGVLCCAVLCGAVGKGTVPESGLKSSAVRCGVLCCAVLCCAVLCCAVLFCSVL